MIKRLILSLTLAFSVFHGQATLAHGGGHAPITDQQAILVATGVVDQFVARDPGLGFGKLGASWKNLPANAKKIKTRKPDYYIVGVTNKKEGKTLFVLMTRSGEVYDANFSGVFKGLK